MAQGALRVDGYREFMQAIQHADKQQKREVRQTLRVVGQRVQLEAAGRIAGKDQRTAAGYKTRVRQRGIAVEQSLRKTTGAHPEWGSYQMRNALLPALIGNADETERALEHAMDKVADQFNRGSIL